MRVLTQKNAVMHTHDGVFYLPMKLLFTTILFYLTMSSTMLSPTPPFTIHAQETPAQTPLEVVELWNTTYGTADMDICANLTTAVMRKGKPKSVWVYDSWKQLNTLDYRKEESQIIQQKIDGNTAVIVLQTRIYADGYVDQKELFKLIRVDGEWLIDELIIGDEVLEEERKQEHL